MISQTFEKKVALLFITPLLLFSQLFLFVTPARAIANVPSITSPMDGDVLMTDTPLISGTGDASSMSTTVTIRVYTHGTNGVNLVATTTTDSMGNWSVNTSSLVDGAYALGATADDGSGESSESPPVSVGVNGGVMPSASPTPSPSPSPSPSASASPSPSASASPSPSASASMPMPSASQTPSPSPSATETPSASPSLPPSPVPSASATPAASASRTPSPTPTPAASASQTPSPSPTLIPPLEEIPEVSPTETPTPNHGEFEVMGAIGHDPLLMASNNNLLRYSVSISAVSSSNSIVGGPNPAAANGSTGELVRIATTWTDRNGNFVFPYLSNGDYIVRAEANGIFVASQAVQINGSSPAPITLHPSSVGFLPSTLEAPVNTSLGMVNIGELSNNDTNEVSVTANLRDNSGQSVASKQFVMPAQTKFDLILSDMFPAEKIGTVQFEVLGASTDSFRCDIAYYRQARKSTKRNFDFAYSLPCQIPNYGNSSVLTNKIFPGSTSVARTVINWLTVANVTSAFHSYVVNSYSQEGVLLDTQTIALNSWERSDIDVSRVANITLVTVTPDVDSAPYMAVLNRYDNITSNVRVLALGAHAQYGDNSLRCVPISNFVDSESFTEMGSVSESPTTVSALIYDAEGSLVDAGGVLLPGHGVRHLNFAAQLPINTSGSLCLRANIPHALVFNQTTYYFTPDRELITAFLTTPQKDSGVISIFGSKNFFFGSYIWLRLVNLSGSTATVEVDSDPGDSSELIAGYVLGGHARLDVPLHSAPFTQVLDTYGRFKVNGSISADVVRVIPNKNSSTATNVTVETSVR